MAQPMRRGFPASGDGSGPLAGRWIAPQCAWGSNDGGERRAIVARQGSTTIGPAACFPSCRNGAGVTRGAAGRDGVRGGPRGSDSGTVATLSLLAVVGGPVMAGRRPACPGGSTASSRPPWLSLGEHRVLGVQDDLLPRSLAEAVVHGSPGLTHLGSEHLATKITASPFAAGSVCPAPRSDLRSRSAWLGPRGRVSRWRWMRLRTSRSQRLDFSR